LLFFFALFLTILSDVFIFGHFIYSPQVSPLIMTDSLWTDGYVRCVTAKGGFHKLFYRICGAIQASSDVETVVCVHGLTRNSRDFDALAEAIVKAGIKSDNSEENKQSKSRYRVVTVDVAGRGKSDWLTDKNDYNYNTYVQDMTVLLAHVTAG
jgi:hypothetical protein